MFGRILKNIIPKGIAIMCGCCHLIRTLNRATVICSCYKRAIVICSSFQQLCETSQSAKISAAF